MIDEKRLIEELRKSNYHHASSSREKALLDRTIRIVKEQPKVNEWIPVEERLPEEHDSVYAKLKLKGTDKWNKYMFEKRSDNVNVTIEFYDGIRDVIMMHTCDGEWNIIRNTFNHFKVIAWQPLPSAYKGVSDDVE